MVSSLIIIKMIGIFLLGIVPQMTQITQIGSASGRDKRVVSYGSQR